MNHSTHEPIHKSFLHKGCYSPFFKYTKKKYLEQGTIRIGTLLGYKVSEDAELGDKEEGELTRYYSAEKNIDSLEQFPSFVKETLNLGGENITVTAAKGFRLNQRHIESDHYLFCGTTIYQPEVMKRMGYDVCFSIDDQTGFMEHVSSLIEDRACYLGTHTCVYSEREIDHSLSNLIHPLILKSPRFSHQKEIRAIWRPATNALEPISLPWQDLKRYCSIL